MTDESMLSRDAFERRFDSRRQTLVRNFTKEFLGRSWQVLHNQIEDTDERERVERDLLAVATFALNDTLDLIPRLIIEDRI